MNKEQIKIAHVIGARPNIVKLGALYPALSAAGIRNQALYHTGQHYDPEMSAEHLEDFGLPEPDANFEIGALDPARQFGQIILKLTNILEKTRPDLVIVYGDVRSTPAAAIAAFHCDIPVMHYESGLRAHDRIFPEEFNRITTDAYSDLLITNCEAAHNNVLTERRSDNNVFLEGDLMCDAARVINERADLPALKARYKLPEKYAVFTSHRHSNVDQPEPLEKVISILERLAQDFTVVFPAHPRTTKRMEEYGLIERVKSNPNVIVTPPLRYSEFSPLISGAQIVIGDSGGLITECTHLKVRLLHMHHMSERPEAEEYGCLVCVSLDLGKVDSEIKRVLAGDTKMEVPKLWDGHAAERIVKRILDYLGAA